MRTKMRHVSSELPDWLKERAMSDKEFKAILAEKLKASSCPYKYCDGSGDMPAFMSIDGLASKGALRCPCLLDRRRQEAYQILMSEGNMDAYDTMTFESMTDHAHQAEPRRLMEGDSDGFYIFGPVGTGKTYLLAALVNQEIAQGRAAALITVPQLLAASIEVKGGISELERQACRVPYLALDDIGKEKLTGFRVAEAMNMLFRLLNARSLLHDRGLGFTSFSSQYPRDEAEGSLSLKDHLEPDLKQDQGSAMVSRIRGMTMSIYLKGPDLRAGR